MEIIVFFVHIKMPDDKFVLVHFKSLRGTSAEQSISYCS